MFEGPLKMSGMLPAASANWKEMSLSVPPLHEPFFQPRSSINLAGFWPKAGSESGGNTNSREEPGRKQRREMERKVAQPEG